MELRIAADELKRALYRAQGIVERKATMPILANVLLTASKEGLAVTAFDLDIGVVSEHAAEVTKPGSLTVSAKVLFDIVQTLPEAFVTLRKLANQYLEIVSGTAHFKIVGMASEEYPKLPQASGDATAAVKGSALLEMVKKTSFAVSTDETRYILNGVFFEPREGGTVRMVATDGHRLCLAERQLGSDYKLKAGVIIPRKGLLELKRLLDEAPDAECHLGFAESSAIFRKPGLTMVMRLIDGQFPEYQRVIPKEGPSPADVPRIRFLEGLKRIALLSADKSYAVKISLAPGLLKIASQNPDLGEAQDELEVGYSGKPVTVGFNARYLMDVLQALETEKVAFDLNDDASPGVIHPPQDRGTLAVVMPMRV